MTKVVAANHACS